MTWYRMPPGRYKASAHAERSGWGAGLGSPSAAILTHKKRDALGFCVKNMSEESSGRRLAAKE